MKRDWEADKKTLIKSLKSIFEVPEGYHFNVWLIIYTKNKTNLHLTIAFTETFIIQILILCEGTRFTEEKHKKSMEYARAKGFKELKHHLLPRTKGFTLLMQLAKNKGIQL